MGGFASEGICRGEMLEPLFRIMIIPTGYMRNGLWIRIPINVILQLFCYVIRIPFSVCVFLLLSHIYENYGKYEYTC